MANPELGTKRVCLECSTKYFDLNRKPIACPKCGAIFEIATRNKSRPADAEPEKEAADAASPEVVAEKAAGDDTDSVDDGKDEPEIISLDEAEEPDAGGDDDDVVASLPDDDLVIDDDDDDGDDVFVKDDDDDDDVSDIVVSSDDDDDT